MPLHRSFKGNRSPIRPASHSPFIIKKFQFILCAKCRTAGVTFRAHPSPTRCIFMALNRIHTHLGRLLAVWVAVAGLMAAEHHGVIKSGGLPVPGASITATKGDKKLFTTSDENGRYSFADLEDGSWTIEVEMLGFAKLSNEVGIAFDAPSPEWNLKFLSMSAITAAAAAPAPAPSAPANPPASSPAPATAKPSETVETAKAASPATAPKPAANAGTSRQQANGARGTQGGRGQNGANGRPSLLQSNGFQRARCEFLGRCRGRRRRTADWRPASWPILAIAPTRPCWLAAASAAAWTCLSRTIGSAVPADAWTAWAAAPTA